MPTTDALERRRMLAETASAESVLNSTITRLNSTDTTLPGRPGARFSETLNQYASRHAELGLEGPRPRLRAELERKNASQMSRKIEAATQYLNLAQAADPLVQPVLMYYAYAHLSSVYTRSLFDWENDHPSEGISFEHQAKPERTVVKLQPNGHIARLATTLTICQALPNCFSELFTDQTRAKGGKAEVGEPIAELTLADLAAFDFATECDLVARRFGVDANVVAAHTQVVLDAITISLGRSFGRYDVRGWRRILEKSDHTLRIHFQKCFDRFVCFLADYFIAALFDPFLAIDDERGYASPYANAASMSSTQTDSARGLLI